MEIVNLRNGKRSGAVPAAGMAGGVMAFGFFDGVHTGHRELISRAAEYARGRDISLTVWSFSSLPKAETFISTKEERLAALGECGADYAVLEDFGAVCGMSPDEFFDGYVKERFSPSAVFCGFNFRYGKNAEGTVDDFRRSAGRNGCECFVLPPYEWEGQTVSSSAIRKCISDGRIAEANGMLGHPYTITSRIVHGKKLGRRMGFATINQKIPAGKVTPRFGVYACEVCTEDGTVLRGVCNIGMRPTVDGTDGGVNLETHLFGEYGEMYGETVTTGLVGFIRDEKRFASVEELSLQIKKDIGSAREMFGMSRGHGEGET